MRFLISLLVSLVCFAAQAQQELIDRTFSGSSNKKNAVEARREIQNQAASQITEEIVKELIGAERFQKNRSVIQNKIIKNSARFIPFSKNSEVKQEGDEYKMSVSMRVSLRDLRMLLQENSLLSENDSVPVVIPAVVWVDRVNGQAYRWWTDSPNPFLVKESRVLEDALRAAFQKNNFYFIKPVEAGLGESVPSDFRVEKLREEDLQFLAQRFNAPLVIEGQVMISETDRRAKIEIKLVAVQVSNGKTIADVVRKYESEFTHFENTVDAKLKEVGEALANDLANQVLEAWQKGSVGASTIRLTIRGRNVLPMMESLKDSIRSQVSLVKNIKERLVNSEEVSFEVDTTASTQELVPKLLGLQINGRKLTSVSSGQSEIVLQWMQ